MSKLAHMMRNNERGNSFTTRDTKRSRSQPTPVDEDAPRSKRDEAITDDPFEFSGPDTSNEGFDPEDRDDYDDDYDNDYDDDYDDEDDESISDVLDDLLAPDEPSSVEEMMASLFDDEEAESSNDPLDRFIDLLEGRSKKKSDNNDDSDDDDQTYKGWWESSWGDGIDFSEMFNQDADEAEVATNLNEQLSNKMSGIIRNVLGQMIDLSNSQIEIYAAKQKKETAATKVRTDTRSALLEAMPFIKKRAEKLQFDSVFDKIWEKTAGDKRKAAALMLKLYRETNPREFRNTSKTSFKRPKGGRNGRSRKSKWDDIL